MPVFGFTSIYISCGMLKCFFSAPSGIIKLSVDNLSIVSFYFSLPFLLYTFADLLPPIIRKCNLGQFRKETKNESVRAQVIIWNFVSALEKFIQHINHVFITLSHGTDIISSFCLPAGGKDV